MSQAVVAAVGVLTRNDCCRSLDSGRPAAATERGLHWAFDSSLVVVEGWISGPGGRRTQTLVDDEDLPGLAKFCRLECKKLRIRLVLVLARCWRWIIGREALGES